jgi:hypothetical protein
LLLDGSADTSLFAVDVGSSLLDSLAFTSESGEVEGDGRSEEAEVVTQFWEASGIGRPSTISGKRERIGRELSRSRQHVRSGRSESRTYSVPREIHEHTHALWLSSRLGDNLLVRLVLDLDLGLLALRLLPRILDDLGCSDLGGPLRSSLLDLVLLWI